MNKINVLRLIADHFRTLKDFQTDRILKGDIFLFFAVPLGIAVGCAYFRISFDKDALIAVLTAFSIFAGLLFSLLLLVFSMAEKVDSESMLHGVRKRLIEELYSNISFSILVSIAVVTIAIIAATAQHPELRAESAKTWASECTVAPCSAARASDLTQPVTPHPLTTPSLPQKSLILRAKEWGIGQRLISFFLVLLMANFILTILMVLKRMHALLTVALKEQPQREPSLRRTA